MKSSTRTPSSGEFPPSRKGIGSPSAILTISIGGVQASILPWGWASHSSRVNARQTGRPAFVSASEDAVDRDVFGSHAAAVASLLDVVGWVQVVQCMQNVHGDVGACAASSLPDRRARGTDEQLRGGRRLAETVRRADHGVAPAHAGAGRETGHQFPFHDHPLTSTR